MKKNSASTSLVLMEILLSVCIFALLAAMSSRIFVTAGMEASHSVQRTEAVMAAQSVAECFKNAQGDIEQLTQRYPLYEQDGMLVCYYDSQWQPQQMQGQFRLQFIVSESDGLAQEGAITVTDQTNGQELFHLDVITLGGGQGG